MVGSRGSVISVHVVGDRMKNFGDSGSSLPPQDSARFLRQMNSIRRKSQPCSCSRSVPNFTS